ncbi:hypothetical protein ACFL5Z_07085 [Planctomycetota bacterium]
MITAVSMGGAFCQGSAIAFLAFFINVMQSKTKTGISYIDKFIGNNVSSLFLMCGILFLLIFFSAMATYYSAIKSRSLARKYHAKCSTRILKHLSRLRFVDLNFNYSQGYIHRMLVRNSMLMGRSIEGMIQSIQPFLNLIVTLLVIFKFSRMLTLTVIPLFLILLPFLYRLSGDIQKGSRRFYENSIHDMTKRLRKFLGFIAHTNISHRCEAFNMEKLYVRNPQIRAYYDDFDKMLLANDRAIFITATFKSFFLIFVLLMLGYNALYNSLAWGIIIAYIVALQRLINYLQALAGHFSNLSRFYPLISDYIDFHEASSQPSKYQIESGRIPERIVLSNPAILEGGDKELTLKAGDKAIYYNPHNLNRFNFLRVLSPLIKSSSIPERYWYRSCFVSVLCEYFPDSIYANIIGGDIDQEKIGQLKETLNHLDLLDEVESLPDGIMTEMTDEIWETLSDELKLGIKILPLLYSDDPIVFLDVKMIQNGDNILFQKLLAFFSDRLLFLTTKNSNVDQPYAEKIIVSNENEIVGIGNIDWFDRIKPNLHMLCEVGEDASSDGEEELIMDM